MRQLKRFLHREINKNNTLEAWRRQFQKNQGQIQSTISTEKIKNLLKMGFLPFFFFFANM